jgi:hypothetical protein
MKRIICLTMMVTVLMVGFAFAGTINLPKTGQTKCYDTAGVEIPCAGTGQDGEIQAGVEWPEPRFNDNSDGTMTDNLTGLMWTKDANLYGYLSWNTALVYCNNLTLGGHSDWRLPNVNELESLVNANEWDSATWLNTQGFTNVRSGNYWSSTAAGYYPGFAWNIDMTVGSVLNDRKSFDSSFVWPVRGGQCGSLDHSVICLPKTGQTKCYDTVGTEIPCSGTGQDGEIQAGVARPDSGFTDHGNGTVTDNLTGLMWTKNANLPNGRTWQQALDYVSGMNAGAYPNLGYTDWRLPNRKELFSLIDYSRYNLALPADHPFANVQNYRYWSSTNSAYWPDSAWYVDMWYGSVNQGNKSSYSLYVWPVR